MENIGEGKRPVLDFPNVKNGIVGIRHRLHNTDRCVGQEDAPVERLPEQLNVVLQGRRSALGERGLQQNSCAMEVGLEGIDVDSVGHYVR